MYLLYQAQKQGIQVSSDILKNWRKLELPENLREVFERFIEEPPELNDNIINLCSQEFIISVYKFTYAHYIDNYPATSTPRYLYSLISFLLEPDKQDKIADFYGNPSFLQYLSSNGINNNFCFISSEPEWIFFQLYFQITGNTPYCDIIKLDLINDGLSDKEQELFKYDKIYAFPPFYQKLSEKDLTNNVRIVRHMQRGSVDKTEALIMQVVNSLYENGRAVVLVSNSIFTRKYAELQKQIVSQKYLSKIINIPRGIIYPKNISTSLLVFDKKQDNNGIDFVDLRFCIRESKHSVDNNELMAAASLLLSNPSDFSGFVSYDKIIDSDYDLNSSTYITGMNYYLVPEEEKFLKVAEENTSYNSKKDFFILENEAQIFRGVQDVSGIIEEEKCTDKSLPLCRFLKISDIEDNRIKETMSYVRIAKRELYKFLLTDRDIVITKTAMPVKFAIVNTHETILPAGNIFVIRLNEDSELNRYYLMAYLESNKGIEKLMQLSSGGSLVSLTKGKLETFQIPYLSKEEQLSFEEEYKKIESKILELEKELDKMQNKKILFIEKQFPGSK